MEWYLDRDLERLRDLEADFVDLDIAAVKSPQTAGVVVRRRRVTFTYRGIISVQTSE